MQSFVFSEMNKASRNKDESKIQYYGAFASALGFIIHCGNNHGKNKNEQLTVYRGLQISKSELETKFVPEKTVNLLGFTSTSLDITQAKKFALEQLKSDKMAVILKIDFTGSNQYFMIDSPEYSSYPQEQEVILQEGVKYLVNRVYQETTDGQALETPKDSNQYTITFVELTNVPDKYNQVGCCLRGIKYLTS